MSQSQKQKPPNAGKGRVKGVPNKATRDVRAAVALVAQNKSADLEKWLDQTAQGIKTVGKDGKVTTDYLVKPDPGRAAMILGSIMEFHIPKLQRTELSTGSDTLKVEIIDPTRRSGNAAK